jgi:hypothetical protein
MRKMQKKTAKKLHSLMVLLLMKVSHFLILLGVLICTGILFGKGTRVPHQSNQKGAKNNENLYASHQTSKNVR